MYCFF